MKCTQNHRHFLLFFYKQFCGSDLVCPDFKNKNIFWKYYKKLILIFFSFLNNFKVRSGSERFEKSDLNRVRKKSSDSEHWWEEKTNKELSQLTIPWISYVPIFWIISNLVIFPPLFCTRIILYSSGYNRIIAKYSVLI